MFYTVKYVFLDHKGQSYKLCSNSYETPRISPPLHSSTVLSYVFYNLIVMIQFDHRTMLSNYDGSDLNVIITFPSISPVDNLFVNILTRLTKFIIVY